MKRPPFVPALTKKDDKNKLKGYIQNFNFNFDASLLNFFSIQVKKSKLESEFSAVSFKPTQGLDFSNKYLLKPHLPVVQQESTPINSSTMTNASSSDENCSSMENVHNFNKSTDYYPEAVDQQYNFYYQNQLVAHPYNSIAADQTKSYYESQYPQYGHESNSFVNNLNYGSRDNDYYSSCYSYNNPDFSYLNYQPKGENLNDEVAVGDYRSNAHLNDSNLSVNNLNVSSSFSTNNYSSTSSSSSSSASLEPQFNKDTTFCSTFSNADALNYYHDATNNYSNAF